MNMRVEEQPRVAVHAHAGTQPRRPPGTRARFGTDGIRGVAGTELTPELAVVVGRALAHELGPGPFVVGRDTRLSGPMLQNALSAGLASQGCDVYDCGVVPTPGVASIAQQRDVPGVVISASHNPFHDNGIKVFAHGGRKLDEGAEKAIEATVDAIIRSGVPPTSAGATMGRIVADARASEAYVAHLWGAIDGRDLAGLNVVVDASNGAASDIAPGVLERLGAGVVAIATSPDGMNINDACGSTHPEALKDTVLRLGADVGLALDGDADRLVAVDAFGTELDGDVLLALFAADLKARGRLAGDTIVATVMSNLGLARAMDRLGISVMTCPVGDRHVLSALDKGGFVLGGEQSGHIVFRELATTGDGILTGILLCDLLRRTGAPLASLGAGAMTRVPQRVVNVPALHPAVFVADPDLLDMVRRTNEDLAGHGRALLRASGTEPIVRVMVEADDEQTCATVAGSLGRAVAALAQPVAASLGK